MKLPMVVKLAAVLMFLLGGSFGVGGALASIEARVIATDPAGVMIAVGGAGGTPGTHPDWVRELQAQDRAAARQAYAKTASSPPSTTE